MAARHRSSASPVEATGIAARMDIEFNNVCDLDTGGSGWFIGFSEWAKSKLSGASDLRYMPEFKRCHTLCMKWMRHPARDPRGLEKPLSTGRTLSLLVSDTGQFRLEFSTREDFSNGEVVHHTLRRHGDFAIWGERVYHRWFAEQESTILTLRWIPE
jgi:hypothetical protein